MISFTDLVKKVLAVYTNNFKLILGILAISIIWNLTTRSVPVSLATAFNYMIPVMILSFIISGFTELALVRTLFNLSQNKPISIGIAWSEALRKLPWFILILIVWLIIMLIGTAFLIIPAIIFAIWFMFLTPVLVVENIRSLAILKRSKQLVSGYFFPLLLRAVAIILPSLFIVIVASQGFYNIVNSVSPVSALPYLNIVSSLFNALLSTLFLPIISGAIVILYCEMRRIKK